MIFEWKYYSQHLIEVFYVLGRRPGLLRRLLGGLLGLWLASRHKKLRLLKLMDCIAPGVVLAQAIGRWGNFFNQEAFGLPVNNGALYWFPLCVRIDGVHYFNGELCSNPYHLPRSSMNPLGASWCSCSCELPEKI